MSSGSAAPPDIFIDAGPENTVQVSDSKETFFAEKENPPGLWEKQETGFDVNTTTAAYSCRMNDAPMLKTTASGLEPGKTYGVYVCFISPTQFSWRIWAGFEESRFDLFTPTEPQDRITDLGARKRKRAHHQFIGLIGDAKADAKGTISVYIDDAQGKGNHERTVYEGIALGAPTGKAAPGKIAVAGKTAATQEAPAQEKEYEKWEPYPVWEKCDVPNPNPNQDRPNILWITCEDISPYLGCYGVEQALTPNLDKLAENGVCFTRAYAGAPVCAVARSSILTGMFSPVIGTHGMRVRTSVPEVIEAYPAIFKKAGYFCTNNSKTDYNCNPYSGLSKVIWDQCDRTAHWKNRPEGKPFFAVFNYGATHESHMGVLDRKVERGELPPEPRIPFDEVKIPAYHPDLPEIRRDWARFHELITVMDKAQGKLIQEVIDAGLWDDTIVVFYSDHGGVLSRSKRYIYNGGTQVPLIVRVPEKWKHLAPGKPGMANDEFVQFVDLPKTMLDICGLRVPEVMQGRVFMGPNKEPAPKTMICYRDRQSARFDCSRVATDGEHYLIRNFYPHRPRGRDGRYGPEKQANWAAWEAWYDGNPEAAGPIFSQFYRPKPVVELFDMQKDPDQVKNLAGVPALEAKLEGLSAELDTWMIEKRDLGVVPEPMLFEMTGDGKKHATLYEYGQSDDYPVGRILEAAKTASTGGPGRLSTYLAYLNDSEPAIRYWGAYALFYNRISQPKVETALKTMIKKDELATNRIVAAQALAWCGDSDAAFKAIMNEVKPDEMNAYVLLFALNAFQYSHTDKNLTKEDWMRFKKIAEGGKTRRNRAIAANSKGQPAEGLSAATQTYIGFGDVEKMADDALALWPERRRVD